MFTQLREILYTDSQDMLEVFHSATTTAAQMAAPVPEIMNTTSFAKQVLTYGLDLCETYFRRLKWTNAQLELKV
jgi:hypothetical protein